MSEEPNDKKDPERYSVWVAMSVSREGDFVQVLARENVSRAQVLLYLRYLIVDWGADELFVVRSPAGDLCLSLYRVERVNVRGEVLSVVESWEDEFGPLPQPGPDHWLGVDGS